MKGRQIPKTLWEQLAGSSDCAGRFLSSAGSRVSFDQILSGTSLAGRIPELSGKSVLLNIRDQLPTAIAMIELDGIARRLIVTPPDLSDEHLASVVNEGEVDAIVFDATTAWRGTDSIRTRVLADSVRRTTNIRLDQYPTEWVLLTSGTTGAPKMVVHSMASLAASMSTSPHKGPDVIWGTFYDIRRYGGLQIFLRAIVGGSSLVLSHSDEPSKEHLVRLGTHCVTHMNGTPSHWRRALMSNAARRISPQYIRLSGEISDQPILNTLRSFYPHALIAHAFASTEAGVGFEVTDGLEGFPANIVGATGETDLKVEDSSLRMRSRRTATRYLGENAPALADADGFIDTGDIVERRGERYYFLGRRSGVINVGGLKVYPEEVEAQINRHPAVHMSCVRPQRSPITGSIVVADVVLRDESRPEVRSTAEIGEDILKICRQSLPRHKVPVKLRFVPHLSVAATGKLARHNA